MRVWAMIVMLVVSVAGPAAADDAQRERFYQNFAQLTFADVQTVIRPTLDAHERAVFDRTRLVVTNSSDIDARASIGDTGNVIAITAGLIGSLDYVASVGAVVEAHGLDNLKIAGFVDDFTSYLQQARAARAAGQPAPPQTVFAWTYFGVSQAQWYAWLGDRRVAESQSLVMTQAMTFIYAHELAHHVLGHLDTDEESPQQERDADDWAMRKTAEIGGVPMMAATVFMTYASLEGYRTDSASKDTHPLSMCRVLRVVNFDVTRILNTPSVRARISDEQAAQLIEARRNIEEGARMQNLHCVA